MGSAQRAADNAEAYDQNRSTMEAMIHSVVFWIQKYISGYYKSDLAMLYTINIRVL